MIIWSPWRSTYIRKTIKREEKSCILCELYKKDDKESYIVYRGKYSYVVLNAYPYNTGHLMIVPYRHIGSILELTSSEIDEIFDKILKKSINVLNEALNPDGYNIGINLGRAAGAGIEEHVHVHVVPRWVGDTNFMPVIGNAKSLPMALNEVYELIKSCWEKSDEEALDH